MSDNTHKILVKPQPPPSAVAGQTWYIVTHWGVVRGESSASQGSAVPGFVCAARQPVEDSREATSQ